MTLIECRRETLHQNKHTYTNKNKHGPLSAVLRCLRTLRAARVTGHLISEIR